MVKNTKLNLLRKLLCYFTIMNFIPANRSKLSLNMSMQTFISPFIFFSILFSFSGNVSAQYYYKDIWNNRQAIKEFAILKANNLKTIKIKSFEDDGEPSDGFFCEKKINKNFTQSQMISKSNITGQALLVTDYNNEGLPVKTTDDTPNSTNTTQFEYDKEGRLTLVTTFTKADDDSVGITETREYFYNEKGLPEKMLRKKNNELITTITFISDTNGNIIEEDPVGTKSIENKYFYYYDDKNRLTDVVHYNARAGRLLPSYIYEYNAINLPKQMISTEEGSSNYLIWSYTYNDKNLRETEKCFSKERRLLGRIEYEYK